MMLKRIAVAALFTLGALGAAASPATATTVVVLNGDFKGATYASWQSVVGGQVVPPAYGFGAHSYLDNFAWSNTGSGALSYVGEDGTQIRPHDADHYLFTPDKPQSYAGYIYASDGAAEFNGGTYLTQLIENLIVGKNYSVSFLQGGGSLYQVAGDTTQWQVGFGGATKYGPYGPNGGDTTILTGASKKLSPLMTSDATGTSPWERKTLTFHASKPEELLSFFAKGSGAPPFALLADVSISVTAVPEPATWAMMIGGFGVIGFAMRRRRRIEPTASYA